MNNKEKIHILFVCGYGVGTSVIMENNVRRALDEKKIEAEMIHSSIGEVGGYLQWADIMGVSKKLVGAIEGFTNDKVHIIEIVNLMDGKYIADQVEEIMKTHFPEKLEK